LLCADLRQSVAGARADRHTIGHATVYRAGLIWSAVALLLVSYAPSYGAMLVFRCLQGVGAALVMSCGAALVTSLYGEERRGRALGVYTMMMASGWMLGPCSRHADGHVGLARGVLVPNSDRHRGAAAVARYARIAPRPADDALTFWAHRADAGPGDDVDGAQPLTEFSAVWLGLLSALAFAALSSDNRARSADYRARGFSPARLSTLNLVSVLANIAAFSVWLLVPYYLTRVRGYTLTESGAILARRGRAVWPDHRRPPHRAANFRRTAGHCRRAGIGRSPAAGRMDGADLDSLAGRRADRAGHRPRLFQLAYSDIVTAALPLRDRGVAGSLACSRERWAPSPRPHSS